MTGGGELDSFFHIRSKRITFLLIFLRMSRRGSLILFIIQVCFSKKKIVSCRLEEKVAVEEKNYEKAMATLRQETQVRGN